MVPLGSFETGASFTALTMDEMMVRTVQDPEPNEYGERFDAGNLAIGLAFMEKLTIDSLLVSKQNSFRNLYGR